MLWSVSTTHALQQLFVDISILSTDISQQHLEHVAWEQACSLQRCWCYFMCTNALFVRLLHNVQI